MDEGCVTLRGSEPIFPVSDVVATVRYYREVLGFRVGEREDGHDLALAVI